MMKKLNLALLVACMIAYGVLTIVGHKVSAWEPLMWIALVFIRDISDYMDGV